MAQCFRSKYFQNQAKYLKAVKTLFIILKFLSNETNFLLPMYFNEGCIYKLLFWSREDCPFLYYKFVIFLQTGAQSEKFKSPSYLIKVRKSIHVTE